MSVNSKMTALADEIRELSGITEAMGLDAMATNIGVANSEVDSQTELLAQAVAALEGKVGGGSEPSLQSKSVTPSAVQQTVVPDSGYDGLSKVTVNAIPSTYVKPTATKSATTYTPTTSNQTIAAGTYCSGAQTIKGDANLVAGNIKSGVSIFGVAGSYEGSGGGSGGGSVETCTVVITTNANTCGVSAMQYINGTIKAISVDTGENTKTITDVICGSCVTVADYIASGIPGTTVNGAVQISPGSAGIGGTNRFPVYVFEITAAAGETATITIRDDD